VWRKYYNRRGDLIMSEETIRKLPNNLLDHIKKQVESIPYGSVTIQLQGEGKIDVITQQRERFDK
jgi:hypothetical protein